MKKGFKQFLIRFSIFLLIVYILIPFLIKLFSSIFNVTRYAKFNLLHIVLFSLLAFLLFILFNKKKLKDIKEYNQEIIQTILFALFGLNLFILYVFIAHYITANLFINLILSYTSYFIGCIFIFFAVFNQKFIKRFYKSLILFVSIIILFFGATLILNHYWFIFSSMIVKSVAFLLRFNYSDVSYIIEGDPILSLNNFFVIIGSPCSGIDSLIMFSVLFFVFLIYDWNLINKKKALILFPFGLIGMFLMSIIRIYLLMVIGIYRPELAMNLFHTNAGWILFVVYFLGFFYFAYPRLKTDII